MKRVICTSLQQTRPRTSVQSIYAFGPQDAKHFLECLCKAAHSSWSTSTLRLTTSDNTLFSAFQKAYARRVLHGALPFGLMLLECSMFGMSKSRTSTGSKQARSASSRFQGRKVPKKTHMHHRRLCVSCAPGTTSIVMIAAPLAC